MTKRTLNINDHDVAVDLQDDMPVLWVLRDVLNMHGTKFSCTMGLCGSCTIQVDGVAARSCLLPVSDIEGKKVRTIEGLAGKDGLHPLQQAWIDHKVPQCGYCQSGQLMAASAFLVQTPTPTDEEIDEAMAGNLCRCGTYPRIKAAIRSVAPAPSKSATPA
jgi:isoquinoline 1-oxidoreductase alpha subunit